MNLLLGDSVADTMDMAVATLTGNGRDPEVPVISAAMKNVATTARTIGSGSIGISGPRGAGKSTVLNKFDTRDAAWKSEQDIRVTVAAPVDYDAREFIIHLFTELCTRVAAEAPPPGPHRAADAAPPRRPPLPVSRRYDVDRHPPGHGVVPPPATSPSRR
jgi:hypothetical protein